MNIGVDIRTLSFRKGGISHFTYGLLKTLTRLDKVNRYLLFNFTKSPYEWDTFRGNVQEIVLRLPQRRGLKKVWETILLPFAASIYNLDAWFSPDFLVPRFLQIPSRCHDSRSDIYELLRSQEQGVDGSSSQGRLCAPTCREDHSHQPFHLQDLRKVFSFEEAKLSVIPLAADERFHPIKDKALVSAVLKKVWG